MKSVRERIRAAMQRAGVTQGQLAEACGVTGPAVNQWLTGKTRQIDPGHLVHVASCTNTSLKWLMTGEGAPGRRPQDPLTSAEECLLKDFRKLSPRMRLEVGRLVKAISVV